ncbi:unnamed protein product [Tilletia controversa]|uniref:rRNA biogenesis protein RRP36 n=3 Tax=Tilletia TaxID=13289 RepID=A0A8X7N0H3_9BASI|nr:hypothetical protein CF336_g568 [Tilletia laevis]KAE8204977.1 hypothetical protein CF328_g762 [Tilletia controversa]KAE8265330.1 hypothetical protein A4X03_0g339 [Tilletia caries]KAE8208641.1 hypothetical protein CF335_g264 [Tilletia laevis]KAE8254317.1 hypothetical protein A4X06_0g954 [Tilletia controversa]
MRVKGKQPEHEPDVDDYEEEEDEEDEFEEEEEDAPKPRYAAYHGESDLDDSDEDEEDEAGQSEQSEEDEEDDVDKEKMLRQELGSLPLAALLKARAALDADEPADNTKSRSRRTKGAGEEVGSDDSDDEDDAAEDDEEKNFKKERREISKRADKSAPMEMSSKRAVTRKRQVIETPKTHVRDPRFDSLSTSAFDSTIFSRSYSFVNSAQSSELSSLRKQYSDLRRAVAARAPSDERAAKGLYSSEAMALRTEKERVGQQIKRLESVAAEKERREREAEVKRNLRKVNDERQKQGQEPVFFKRAQMKGVILQDKFERLSSDRPGKGRATGSNRTQASPSTASNMSVDRLRAMISSGSNTVPASSSSRGGSGGAPDDPSSANGQPSSSSSSAIKKLIVRKAKKDAKKDRKDLPFLVRDRGAGTGGEGQGQRASAGKDEGSKKRHRGSRGSGGTSKKPRTQ